MEKPPTPPRSSPPSNHSTQPQQHTSATATTARKKRPNMGLLRLLVATLAVTCAVLSPPVAANRSVSWQKGQVVDAYRRAANPHLRESRENSRYKDLMVAVQRTRKRVKCRDSDIIIVSHPKVCLPHAHKHPNPPLRECDVRCIV